MVSFSEVFLENPTKFFQPKVKLLSLVIFTVLNDSRCSPRLLSDKKLFSSSNKWFFSKFKFLIASFESSINTIHFHMGIYSSVEIFPFFNAWSSFKLNFLYDSDLQNHNSSFFEFFFINSASRVFPVPFFPRTVKIVGSIIFSEISLWS